MNRACALVVGVSVLAASGCAPRAATCLRACDAPFSCAASGCVRPQMVPAIEARDAQVRRVVLAPVAVARIAPGPVDAEASRAAVLGRSRDARATLLLRFAVALAPGTTILEADLVLARAPSFDADPSPVVLHAVRVAEPWDPRSLAWGRAPRLDDALRLPSTTVDDPRAELRLDVRRLVSEWRRHATRDQGIAVVADVASPTGAAFALADGEGEGDAPRDALSVHGAGPAPVFSAPDGPQSAAGARPTRGPRLELYVRP